MHSDVLGCVHLCYIRLDERGCKGGPQWVKVWLTKLQPHCYIRHLHCFHNLKKRLNKRDREKSGNDEKKNAFNERGGERLRAGALK